VKALHSAVMRMRSEQDQLRRKLRATQREKLLLESSGGGPETVASEELAVLRRENSQLRKIALGVLRQSDAPKDQLPVAPSELGPKSASGKQRRHSSAGSGRSGSAGKSARAKSVSSSGDDTNCSAEARTAKERQRQQKRQQLQREAEAQSRGEKQDLLQEDADGGAEAKELQGPKASQESKRPPPQRCQSAKAGLSSKWLVPPAPPRPRHLVLEDSIAAEARHNDTNELLEAKAAGSAGGRHGLRRIRSSSSLGVDLEAATAEEEVSSEPRGPANEQPQQEQQQEQQRQQQQQKKKKQEQ